MADQFEVEMQRADSAWLQPGDTFQVVGISSRDNKVTIERWPVQSTERVEFIRRAAIEIAAMNDWSTDKCWTEAKGLWNAKPEDV